MTGQDFAGFAITRRLASGGMTYLYIGVDSHNQRVVLRRLKPEYLKDKRYRASFLHGAEILSKLHHPNVVRMLKAGTHQDEPYMVVEFVESHSMRDLVTRREPVLRENILVFMRQMAAALNYVHQSGFLHLDFKPDNLLVRYDGLVVLVDFDLALERKPRPIKLSPLPGTFSYLPPEALSKGLVDEQTDIYAFGVTCYEILTGHKPFEGVTLEDSKRMQMDPSVQPPRLRLHSIHVPPAIEALIFKCLAHRQEARYPSMSLVQRDLDMMV